MKAIVIGSGGVPTSIEQGTVGYMTLGGRVGMG